MIWDKRKNNIKVENHSDFVSKRHIFFCNIMVWKKTVFHMNYMNKLCSSIVVFLWLKTTINKDVNNGGISKSDSRWIVIYLGALCTNGFCL
jgi:hypothetical protein